jgi:hypothetical protein
LIAAASWRRLASASIGVTPTPWLLPKTRAPLRGARQEGCLLDWIWRIANFAVAN